MKKTYLFLAGIITSMSLFAQDYSQVYLIGGATPNGWSNDKAQTMTLVESNNENAVFTWTGFLTASDFKFINALNTWQPSFNSAIENEQVILGSTHNLVYNVSGNDHKFILNNAGFYTVTVDLKKLTMLVEQSTGELPDELWISGTAILDGTVKLLKKEPETGKFIYGGGLLQGDYKIRTTATVNENTRYIVPVEEYTDVTGETGFQITADADVPGWEVIVDDPVYKIGIHLLTKKSNAEILTSAKKLYLVGGATAIGWNAGNAIELVQDSEVAGLFVFDGELKIRDENVEPNAFKILGQPDWGPYSLHPYTTDESILNSSSFAESINGSFADNKWIIGENQQGRYVINVNWLTETVEAEYKGELSSVQKIDDNGIKISVSNGNINIISKEPIDSIALFDISGKLFANKQLNNTDVSFSGLSKGIYIAKFKIASTTSSRKIAVY